jgi:hypothetical protein
MSSRIIRVRIIRVEPRRSGRQELKTQGLLPTDLASRRIDAGEALELLAPVGLRDLPRRRTGKNLTAEPEPSPGGGWPAARSSGSSRRVREARAGEIGQEALLAGERRSGRQSLNLVAQLSSWGDRTEKQAPPNPKHGLLTQEVERPKPEPRRIKPEKEHSRSEARSFKPRTRLCQPHMRVFKT